MGILDEAPAPTAPLHKPT